MALNACRACSNVHIELCVWSPDKGEYDIYSLFGSVFGVMKVISGSF